MPLLFPAATVAPHYHTVVAGSEYRCLTHGMAMPWGSSLTMAKQLWRSDRTVTTCRLPLDTVGLVANKGILGPKYHIYAVDYYFSID